MTYLPERFLHQTEFPTAFDKDAWMQVRMIEETWRRSYPEIQYRSLRRDPKAIDPAEPYKPVAAPGQTTFDPLYREAVDPAMATSGWNQPHASGSLAASAVDVVADPVPVRAQCRREAQDTELKKYGFDEFRDLLVTLTSYSCDVLGLVIHPGDHFSWDGDEFIVLQSVPSGYWMNTNLRFYQVMNCQHAREGA